jgi:hypothetical protein
MRCVTGVAVAAVSMLAAAMPAAAATLPTLTVVVLGSGAVTSQPAGIACPGKCTATFAAGTSVLLTPQSKNGSTFLRWGGPCTGTGACRVKVSALTAVAAQFVAGPNTPPTTKYVAAPGPYSGPDVGALRFYVAPGGKSMLNINKGIYPVGLSCKPSGGFDDSFQMLQVAIQPDGSFNGKAIQNGVLSGSDAKYTYTIAGHFEAATATTAASAGGTYSESIVFASGTYASCSTNETSWTATLYREPSLPKVIATPGNYSGPDVGDLRFSVAPGGRSMINITKGIYSVPLGCAPSGGINESFQMNQVAIQPDGSFSGKTSQSGVFMGANATFTYTITGHFEGVTPEGPSTVAGIYREDVVPSSGTTKMCTSNDQSWTATRT